ncbi:MAG: tRNA preQ1(34) S-adenosylmethionine ribosyltransferase-isomerase QueA [Armatimonadetes bacterium]|nr:tRNA preQ1(34) S-adenosylmethionine ribosyltransferase-isomerase QueA [Armatimonadota bacterium]MDW8029035.1 tRNA preQ1(34) S-adenosylmethionine ribosyltransferase-isomerase QueA [Armatimonadota bacterium]
MRLEELDYELPKDLIAQEPIEPRDHARLLILNRGTGRIEHRRFYELGDYLEPGDVLVINNTKVIRARLRGIRSDTKGKVEVLLLRPDESDERSWRVLLKPGKRARLGLKFVFGEPPNQVSAQVAERLPDGSFRLIFDLNRDEFFSLLDQIGEVPLPPYIKTQLTDDRPYQTVYAHEPGSVAAPTAGLHFTERLLNQLQDKGIKIAQITLHVGWSTFKPITKEIVEQHEIGDEFYRVSKEAAEVINSAWAEGKKVVAVGTTSVRTLETVAVDYHKVEQREGWTELFITVGHQFKAVDALITNFHLPKSSNLLLVAAFCGGMEKVRNAYEEAIRLRYRFYSFGDAMLIL